MKEKEFYTYQVATSLWARATNNLNAMIQQLEGMKKQKEELDKAKENKKVKKEVPADKEYYAKLIDGINKIEQLIPAEQHIIDSVLPVKLKIEKKYFNI